MIIIEKCIVSDDVVSEKFVCHLDKCKGACCIDGDSGAPLDEDELPILEGIFDSVKPYMRTQGVEAVESQGKYLKDKDGDWVTPLVDGKECAYVVFEKGVAFCAIEKAYLDGVIAFRKPISCHLYPVRIVKHKGYDAVNYERRDSCTAACSHGAALNVKVYEFLKDPLTRKYGVEWYNQLEAADHYMQDKLKKPE